jgi:hypothetical protein
VSTAEFLVYLLEHETTRELGRALGEVVGVPLERDPDGELVVSLPA